DFLELLGGAQAPFEDARIGEEARWTEPEFADVAPLPERHGEASYRGVGLQEMLAQRSIGLESSLSEQRLGQGLERTRLFEQSSFDGSELWARHGPRGSGVLAATAQGAHGDESHAGLGYAGELAFPKIEQLSLEGIVSIVGAA